MRKSSLLTYGKLWLMAALCLTVQNVVAQTSSTSSSDGFTVTDNTFNPNRALDSLKASHKEVPKGMFVWTADEKFGDVFKTKPDTAQHLFMNTIFTTGKYGEYNTTGNLASPRIARIATDRDYTMRNPFMGSYDFFLTKPSELHFTNTLSPITNLFFTTCGDQTAGEDHLRVMFATNVNKQLGVGFKFNYAYGKGYYANQNTALFDYTFWASYLGERYQSHFIMSFDHIKVAENGGITNDNYITHPESYKESYDNDEIPTALTDNWNKQDAFSLNFSHRYNVGFYRKVEMTEMEKEAKRFALRAKEEQDKNGKADTKTDGSQSQRNGGVFAGRPDDAAIVGDLPKEPKEKRLPQDKDLAARDAGGAEAKADTSWVKDEYVPVTSFIHSIGFNTNDRRYISNATSDDFYLNRYEVPYEENPGDSIYDKTRYYTLKNTFAIGLLEGFNKYVPMGMKVFLTHEMRHYTLPNAEKAYTSYNETNISIGGQLIKTLGKRLHYKALGEFWLVGKDVGDINLEGSGDLNMRILGDTAAVRLKAFYRLTNPGFIDRHYHGKFFSWSHENLSKQMQTHLEAEFLLRRTGTTLRACYDNIQNYTYLAINYNRTTTDDVTTITGYTADINQSNTNISLITLALEQNFRLGILKWENRLTYQKSTQEEILGVPAFNYWTNLYLDFRIARVLRVNIGGDMRFFTSYYAPEYCPQIGRYGVQQNSELRTKTGIYPVINVYANFRLKQCRFFVMMSHINSGSGNKGYFYTPHYPLNSSILRFGLSWNFYN